MDFLTSDKMNSYLNQLNNLRIYVLNEEEGCEISDNDRENIKKLVFSFLTSCESGIAYKDGLKYTAYLTLRFNLFYENLHFQKIKNAEDPEIRIIIWLISQNSQKSIITLMESDINYCNSHPFWNSLFIEGLKRWPETSSIPAEVLFHFNPLADDYRSYIFLARLSLDMGGITRSSEFLKQGISSADKTTLFRYESIRELREHGLKEESEILIKEALLSTWDGQDADEFINICAIAREQGLYDETFGSTLRFLETANGNLSEEQQFSLDIILLEEFFKQGMSGYYAGIQLYRKYRSKILEKGEIPSFFPYLVIAAQKIGCSEIIRDVAERCKDFELPENPEWWRLKAEIFEFSRAWEDAYSYWQKLLEQNPKNSEIIFRIIENRLVCYDENSADRFVKKLTDLKDPQLRIPTLSYQVLANTSSPTQVIEITRKNKDIFTKQNPLFERVLLAYSEALCTQYEWAELERITDLKGSLGFRWKKFFVDLAKIMNFVHPAETQRPSDRNADDILSLSRDLISSPISTDQILILLNVDIVDKIRKAVLKSDRNFSPLIEELSEEMELRVALEVESLIMKLEERKVNTQDYRKRLREMTLGLGSRQLLEDLEREYRSMGVGV
ncbi:MAG: hypothetical protein ABSB80_09745 [Methanoregula sp.]|jgi:tetratricopeptide (TPR) repeat protein|uniref:hypothetical protein n=1 Tax=Methanoregula sp. TaxID=2052170 RepID=UPI003D0E303B